MPRLILITLALTALTQAQPLSPNLYSEMHWRQIGPPRAGRARALAGVPSQPNVFYIGFDNGGVWRSTDYGSTWVPLFDYQPTGSIGAIAVAPSDPNIDLCRQRRRHHPPRPRHRRWRLQIHRRRQDLDAPRPSRFPDDRQYRSRPARTPTASSSPRWAIPTDPTPNAASSAPPMAARHSRKFSTKTNTPAETTSASIPPTRQLFTPLSGNSSRASMRTEPSAVPMAASINRQMAAPPGRNSQADSRPSFRRISPSPPATRKSFTPP